jgi:protein phosphatase
MSGETVGERMADAVVSADVRVRNEGVRDPTRQGMGTTLTVLYFNEETGDFTIGHVGDSRAYRFRNDELRLLTKDDTWVQAQVDAGRMTADEARYHPWASLLAQAIGLDQPARPAVLTGTTDPGDIFLLCSDGLVTMLTDAEIEAILQDHLSYGLGDVARTLVDIANARGGIDNITVGILKVEQAD